MDLEIFKNNNKFLMLAFDHRGSFKKFINKENPELVTDADAIKTKRIIIENLQDLFSGVLIDEDWGLPAYENKTKPFLLCVEKSGYTEDGSSRITEIKYKIKDLKKLGASGIKLLVYFNPEDKSVTTQLETSKNILLEAKENDLPLFLEIVTYGKDEDVRRGELVLKSLDMFLEFGITPDVFKLEYPGSLENCQKITKKLGDIPWILLTRGVSFDKFKPQLQNAVDAGAVGFLAGRALWQEIVDYKTWEEKENYLKNTVRLRFKEINKITLK